jgi:hypothetical protein
MSMATAFALPGASIASPQAEETDDGKEWTLLIYWDSDNDLEAYVDFAVDTWTSALTDDDEINFIVYMDVLSVTGTWIYDIHDGECHTVETWEELNSSDPATLERFLDYGFQNYPAEKTMLVLQDHGYAWRGVCRDETNGNGIMVVDDMARAITKASTANGVRVDVLGMDVCDAATVEFVYELRGAADYFVASELFMPDEGLPYQQILTALVADPDVSPRDFAHDLVDMYMAYYGSKTLYEHTDPGDQDYATLSAFDMSLVDELGAAFIDVAAALEPLVVENADAVKAALNYAFICNRQSMGGYEYVPDVYTLFRELKGVDDDLDDAIESFSCAFNAALLNEGSSAKFKDVITGLNVWFPPCLALYNGMAWDWSRQFVYHDIGLDLVDDSRWYQCLMEYYFAMEGLQKRPNQL